MLGRTALAARWAGRVALVAPGVIASPALLEADGTPLSPIARGFQILSYSINDKEEFFNKVLAPIAAQSSFGGAMGFFTGFALKRLGKVFAFVIGIGFVSIQTLAYSGYVQVEWGRVQKDIIKVLDADGDGELTPEDIDKWWNKFIDAVQFEIPSTAGFVTGLVLGLRC